MSDPGSWILQLRERLADPPPLSSSAEVTAHVAFVPLFVDAGELWVLLSESDAALALDLGTVAFPGSGLESGQEPWEVVARICEPEIGAEPAEVLRIGNLDAVETLHGFTVQPCVAAVPAPDLETVGRELELVAYPLSALRNPALIEDRRVEIEGREGWIRVYHVGRRRLAGTAAQILESLMARLYEERPPEPSNGA